MNIHQQRMVEGVHEFIAALETEADSEHRTLAYLLLGRLAMPQAYVTVVGETSSGKSTLVNALLGQELLPVSAKPTTGTVTHIACRDEAIERFFAIYRDATQEEIGRVQFSHLNLEPEGDLLRLQIRARPKAEGNIGLHVFDTPGYNAILSQHEEVLQQFLPQSDVIVFVVGYRSGFGQNDQDLLETVENATTLDKNIPIFLVVNRVPPGIDTNDRRVDEIVQHAEDSLGRACTLLLIPTAVGGQSAASVVPDFDPLWDDVREVAFDPKRLQAVQSKLEQYFAMLLKDADAAAARDEARLQADATQQQEIANAIHIARSAHAQSLQEVDSTMANLRLALPQLLERAATDLKVRVETEVTGSNRWLGQTDCTEWVSGHLLPFEVRGIGRAVEDYMTSELDALNRRLEDIANTAISKLNSKVSVRGDEPVARFALSLATTLSRRIAGNAVSSVLRGMGGVGGTAAGAGNLAKMALSKGGKLFGKTFSREVYNQIGRVFTKKMIERLNVALMVLTEVGTFLYDAAVWKKKLIDQSGYAIEEWRKEVKQELLAEQLSSISDANRRIIDEVYGDVIQAGEADLADGDCTEKLESVLTRRHQLAALRDNFFQPSAA